MQAKAAANMADSQRVCEDALLHIESISQDWLPLLHESIVSVRKEEMTRHIRLLVPKICNQLMSALDYIANWAQSTCSGPWKKRKPNAYFFFTQSGDPEARIESELERVYPGLKACLPWMWDFLKQAQILLGQSGSVFQELRRLNATMKHQGLLPAGEVPKMTGTTIVNWGTQADKPPLWVWAEDIDMCASSSFAGGPGSLVSAKDRITCNEESQIFGISGKKLHAGEHSGVVETLDFVPLWSVPYLTKPLLQFVGQAVNDTARLIRQFAQGHKLWDRLWPQFRLAHFGQVLCAGRMTLNPGRVEATWKIDAGTPSVSLITWGKDAEPPSG